MAFDETVIEPGMVFELEPGAYEGEGGGFGCRFVNTIFVGEAGEATRDVDWIFRPVIGVSRMDDALGFCRDFRGLRVIFDHRTRG